MKDPLSYKEKDYRVLPDLGKGVTRGKNAYRMLRGGRTDWRIRLINILDLLIQAEGKR